jgi:hypothetical protein
VGAQVAQWIADTIVAARTMIATTTAPGRGRGRTQRHYRRESFVEDAAMSREMFRL